MAAPEHSAFHSPTARGLLAVALLVWLAGSYWPGTVDDVYISLAYAWQWAHSGALTWVDGQHVEGYSNFLMVALLAGGLKLGADGGLLAQWIALASGIAVLLLASRVLPRTLLGTLTLLGLAVWAPLCHWSVVGMETTLFALLLSLGWLGVCGGERSWGWGVWALALASLTRPEGIAHLVVGLVLRGRRPAERRDSLAASALLALAAYHAVRVWWFGDWLPTSYLVKIAGQPLTWNGALQAVGEVGTAAGILLGAWLASRPSRRRTLLALLPLAIQVAVLVRAGGDWMVRARLVLPGVVAAVVVAAGGRGARRGSRGELAVLVGLLCVFGSVVMPVGRGTIGVGSRSSFGLKRPWAQYSSGLSTPFAEDLYWLVQNVGMSQSLLASDAGVLASVPGVDLVDTGGLVDRAMAESRADGSLEGGIRSWLTTRDSGVFVRVPHPIGVSVGLPGWMSAVVEQRGATQTLEGITDWYATDDALPPSSDDVNTRWQALLARYTAHPEIVWLAARSRAAAGDQEAARQLLERARERWREDGRFADGIASTSFVDGDLPLHYVRGRGFAMYENGYLVSRPLHEGDRLQLDVDAPGAEGVRVSLAVTAPGCPDVAWEVGVTERTTLQEELTICGEEAVLRVAFLNDVAAEAGDRNVYVALNEGL